MSTPIESRPPDKETIESARRWRRREPVGEQRSIDVDPDGAVTRTATNTRNEDVERRRTPKRDSAEYHARRMEEEIDSAAIDRDASIEQRSPELTTADAKVAIDRKPRRVSL